MNEPQMTESNSIRTVSLSFLTLEAEKPCMSAKAAGVSARAFFFALEPLSSHDLRGDFTISRFFLFRSRRSASPVHCGSGQVDEHVDGRD